MIPITAAMMMYSKYHALLILFFTLLSVAALTSTISLLEVPVAYLVDEKKVSRKKIVWIMAGVVFLFGVPSALSNGASDFFSNFGLIRPTIDSLTPPSSFGILP